MYVFFFLAGGVLAALGLEKCQRKRVVRRAELGDGRTFVRESQASLQVSAGNRTLVPSDEPTRLQLARRSLVESGVLIAAATIGSIAAPPLLWFATGYVVARARSLFREGWRAVVHDGKPTTATVDSVFLAVTLLLRQYFLNVVLYGFFCLINWLARRAEDQSRQKLIEVFADQPRRVWIEVDGVDVEIPFEDLEPGHVLAVSAGDLIPVDGVVLSGTASVDQQLLTGESRLVEKASGDEVMASTIVIAGRICIRSTQAGADTLAAQIGAVLDENDNYLASMEARGMQLANNAAPYALTAGGGALALRGVTSSMGAMLTDFGASMRVFGPVSALRHLESASQGGFFVKDGRALELLLGVDTVVFDKTGTLTAGQPEVAEVVTFGAFAEDTILSLAATVERRVTHPIALAIVDEARARGIPIDTVDRTHYELGFGIKVQLQEGMVHIGSRRFMEMEGITQESGLHVLEQQEHNMGHTVVYVALNEKTVGAIRLRPTLRPHVVEVIAALRRYAPTMMIMSGDHEAPTRHLAETLEFDEYFAATLPHQKGEIIEQIQAQGRSVCFIGDGVNDGLALKKAHVSISFHDASDIATDCAQIVMTGDDLRSLPSLFELSRSLDRNMSTSYNITLAGSAANLVGIFVLGMGLTSAAMIGSAVKLAGLANSMRTPQWSE